MSAPDSFAVPIVTQTIVLSRAPEKNAGKTVRPTTVAMSVIKFRVVTGALETTVPGAVQNVLAERTASGTTAPEIALVMSAVTNASGPIVAVLL